MTKKELREFEELAKQAQRDPGNERIRASICAYLRRVPNKVECTYAGQCSDEAMCRTCANNSNARRSYYRPIEQPYYWYPWTPTDTCGKDLTLTTYNDVATTDATTYAAVPFTLTSHYQAS